MVNKLFHVSVWLFITLWTNDIKIEDIISVCFPLFSIVGSVTAPSVLFHQNHKQKNKGPRPGLSGRPHQEAQTGQRDQPIASSQKRKLFIS